MMKNRKGFTLVELLAVIALLAFLAVLVFPNVFSSVREAKKNAFITEAKTVFQEATNKFTEERTEGNKINLVSNEDANGTELKLNSEKDLKYTLKLDKKGKVTSYKIYNDEFCVAGTSSEVDDVSYENLIDFLENPDNKDCETISSVEYNEKEKLTLNLKTRTADNPVISEANPSTIYLKYNDKWYNSDRKDASNINKITIPVKDNYYFKGFSTTDNVEVVDCKGNILLDNHGTGVFNDPNKTTADAYSSFDKKFYIIEYDKNNATSGSMPASKYYYGTKYRLSENKYQRTGYSFDGWNGVGKKWDNQAELPLINDSNENTSEVSAFKYTSRTDCDVDNTKPVKFTARWVANKYVVTLVADYNGRTATVSKKSITVTYDGTYSELPTPSIGGYKFVGWYTQATGGNKVNNTDKVTITSDTTLYAHYTANTFTVAYNSNGGSSVSNQTCTYDAACNLASAPTKDGYTFSGWLKNNTGSALAAGTSIKNEATTGTVTYFAKWSLISYVKTFNYTGTVESLKVPYSGNYVLEVWGAQGGIGSRDGSLQAGGKGGHVKGTVNLSANTTLYIVVGGKGGDCDGTSLVGGTGGYNGGAIGGANSNNYGSGADAPTTRDSAGGGGGATDIRKGGIALSNRIIVAGGGGGGSWYYIGGVGGDSEHTNGTLGTGTNGCPFTGGSGAGGGGYYGGRTQCSDSGHGYGGSNFTASGFSAVTSEAGIREGHGTATVTYAGY